MHIDRHFLCKEYIRVSVVSMIRFAGQKALCAVALTLALQQVYPCPFYLLDEIDSALDSVKIHRLGTVLAQGCISTSAFASISGSIDPISHSHDAGDALSGTTSVSSEPKAQFLVLTHKPEMYDQAGLIVGIFQRTDSNGLKNVQPVYFRQPSSSDDPSDAIVAHRQQSPSAR